MASAARQGRSVHDLEGYLSLTLNSAANPKPVGPWFIPGTPWPDLHWDLNLQYTYYLPIAANRFDLAGTLVDFVSQLHKVLCADHPCCSVLIYIHKLGTLNTNVPSGWLDAAAAPTGASNLRGEMRCFLLLPVHTIVTAVLLVHTIIT